MLKHTIAAAFSLAAITLSPLPVVTGSALGQAASPNYPCTAGPNCPKSGDTYRCSSELGYLRRVYEEDLEVIENPNHVSIVPICSGEDYGVFRADGNAGALRTVIADNEAMLAALDAKNFLPDDVIGVRMTGEDKVILYVHEFLYR